MKLTELVAEHNIILVSGNLCSGKGYYCATQYPEYYHLPVSDVVKRLAKTNVRSQLANTESMDKLIVEELCKYIDAHPNIVIDGIRQVSIIKALQYRYGDNIKDIIWLDVPDDTRRQRFANRADKKDDVSFDDASAGDTKLGIGDVEKYMRYFGRTVNNN